MDLDIEETPQHLKSLNCWKQEDFGDPRWATNSRTKYGLLSS